METNEAKHMLYTFATTLAARLERADRPGLFHASAREDARSLIEVASVIDRQGIIVEDFVQQARELGRTPHSAPQAMRFFEVMDKHGIK